MNETRVSSSCFECINLLYRRTQIFWATSTTNPNEVVALILVWVRNRSFGKPNCTFLRAVCMSFVHRSGRIGRMRSPSVGCKQWWSTRFCMVYDSSWTLVQALWLCKHSKRWSSRLRRANSWEAIRRREGLFQSVFSLLCINIVHQGHLPPLLMTQL